MKIIQIGCNNGRDHVLDFFNKNKPQIEKLVLIDASLDAIKECQKTYNNNSVCEFLNLAIVNNYENYVPLYQPETDSMSEHISLNAEHLTKHQHSNVIKIDVPALNINTLIEKYNPIDRLYIDVEGHDIELINAIDYDKYKIPYICFEHLHTDGTFQTGEKYYQYCEKLKNYGYTITTENYNTILSK
jgi:FkbM family methyltransferase